MRVQESLKDLFNVYANYGTRTPSTELDGAKYVKIFKDAGLVGKNLTSTDLDINFSKVQHLESRLMPIVVRRALPGHRLSPSSSSSQVKVKGARKIGPGEFQASLTPIADKLVRFGCAELRARGPLACVQ